MNSPRGIATLTAVSPPFDKTSLGNPCSIGGCNHAHSSGLLNIICNTYFSDGAVVAVVATAVSTGFTVVVVAPKAAPVTGFDVSYPKSA